MDSSYFWAKTTKDGKPGNSVRDHCLNVGCVAESLFKQLPAELQDLLPPGVVTLAALHDVGKISPGFQVKCPVWITQNKLADSARTENWANHEQSMRGSANGHYRGNLAVQSSNVGLLP